MLSKTGRIGSFYKGGDYVYELSDHLGNVRATVSKNAGRAQVESFADYFPFGEKLPGPNRNFTSSLLYKYTYQGQEHDEETGLEAFDLRLWDGRIGRWLSTDPYGQYHSPYLGMGNNPISRIDPDGGLDWYITPKGNTQLIAGAKGDIEGYTWLSSDNYAFGLDEFTITGDGDAFVNEGGRGGYNLRDIRVREIVFQLDRESYFDNVIAKSIRSAESNGNFGTLNAQDYWDENGEGLGVLLMMEAYIDMMGLPAPGGSLRRVGGIQNQLRGYSPKSPSTQTVKLLPAPKTIKALPYRATQPRGPDGRYIPFGKLTMH